MQMGKVIKQSLCGNANKMTALVNHKCCNGKKLSPICGWQTLLAKDCQST